MKEYKLNADKFKIWTIFQYKWNYCVVLRAEREWVYAIDVEYDPEFNNPEELMYRKLTYWDIEADLNKENILLWLFE